MKMTVRISKIAGTLAFALSALCLYAADSKTNNANLAAKTLSVWHDAPDGKLSACLTVGKTNFSAGDKIAIYCTIRNNTDKPITIFRPFGDPFDSYAGVTVLGPHGPVAYAGRQLDDYILGASSFVELQGRTAMEGKLQLSGDVFPGLNSGGLYTIRYVFESKLEYNAPENFWRGRIETSPVTILVQ